MAEIFKLALLIVYKLVILSVAVTVLETSLMVSEGSSRWLSLPARVAAKLIDIIALPHKIVTGVVLKMVELIFEVTVSVLDGFIKLIWSTTPGLDSVPIPGARSFLTPP